MGFLTKINHRSSYRVTGPWEPTIVHTMTLNESPCPQSEVRPFSGLGDQRMQPVRVCFEYDLKIVPVNARRHEYRKPLQIPRKNVDIKF